MKKIIISTDKAPAAIGPYSQGVEAGSILFTSGQVPIDPVTGQIPQGIEKQTEKSLLLGLKKELLETLLNTFLLYFKILNKFLKTSWITGRF